MKTLKRLKLEIDADQAELMTTEEKKLVLGGFIDTQEEYSSCSGVFGGCSPGCKPGCVPGNK